MLDFMSWYIKLLFNEQIFSKERRNKMLIQLNNGQQFEVGPSGIEKGVDPKTGIETITIPFFSDKDLIELDEIFSDPTNVSKIFLVDGTEAVNVYRNYIVLTETTYNKRSKQFTFLLKKEDIESKLVELVINNFALENRILQLENKATELYGINDYQDECIMELYETGL